MTDTRTQMKIGRRTVTLTNPDKLVYPARGLTKADVTDYYIRIAPYILPYLKQRPFSMISF
ncbi:MAG: DNA polymerase domain-containing protein, partial [Oscillospiraceae bacterium]|nr:DNA polymerase domain-containing protein [Oscillospiraceae bacterium]